MKIPKLDEVLLHLEVPSISEWVQAFDAIHPDYRNFRNERTLFLQQCATQAWLQASMSLLPTNRAVRMHRYRGKRSGWCCVTKPMELPELEITRPVPSNEQLGTEFFTVCPLLEAAVLIVALICARVAGQIRETA